MSGQPAAGKFAVMGAPAEKQPLPVRTIGVIVGAALLILLIVGAAESSASGDRQSVSVPPRAPAAPAAPPVPPGRTIRLLFSGNSFTYGPPAYQSGLGADQGPLTNLPRIFTLVAHSLGTPVSTAEDTIGGCTAWCGPRHRRSSSHVSAQPPPGTHEVRAAMRQGPPAVGLPTPAGGEHVGGPRVRAGR